MLTRLKREWTYLRRSPPGTRFQRRYHRVRARRARHHEGPEYESTRILRLTAAFMLIVLGLFLLVLPFVYIPFLIAGAVLFASESLMCAQGLDRAEYAGRSAWAWLKVKTGISSHSAKLISVIVGIGCLALTGRYCYLAFLR